MEAVSIEYQGLKHCPVCQKDFWVIWPTQWAYRRGKDFLCSWRCIRKYDIEEEERPVTKVTLEQKRRAVELAINGEDPRPYLKECGSRNADLMWGKIREKLKTADPELFAQLPDKIPRSDKGRPRNEPEEEDFTPEDAYSQVVEVPEVKMDGQIRISATEPEKIDVVPQKPKITAPLMHSGKTATAWAGDFGEYHYSRKHGYFDFNGDDGTEMSMPVESWREWLKELHVVSQLLGVEL